MGDSNTAMLQRPMPADAGIGLRARHHLDLLSQHPPVGWLEAHAENYFADGGTHVDCLMRIRGDYPVSLHGVGLSLGSTDELDLQHLERLSRAAKRFEPCLISEHLSWISAGGLFANDLLPLPYTEEALRHVSARIARVQDRLGRQILMENVSSYMQYAASSMTEWEFVTGVAAECGCGILLDINNIYVSAQNHGFDANDYLRSIPANAVQEIHLAGHDRVEIDGREILIDTHGGPVCEEVWDLYRTALQCFGRVPTLIEWDTEIPGLDVLCAEATKADAIRTVTHAVAA